MIRPIILITLILTSFINNAVELTLEIDFYKIGKKSGKSYAQEKIEAFNDYDTPLNDFYRFCNSDKGMELYFQEEGRLIFSNSLMPEAYTKPEYYIGKSEGFCNELKKYNNSN